MGSTVHETIATFGGAKQVGNGSEQNLSKDPWMKRSIFGGSKTVGNGLEQNLLRDSWMKRSPLLELPQSDMEETQRWDPDKTRSERSPFAIFGGESWKWLGTTSVNGPGRRRISTHFLATHPARPSFSLRLPGSQGPRPTRNEKPR